MSCIPSINCNVNDCTNTVTVMVFDILLRHEFSVSNKHLFTIYNCTDSMTTDFFYIFYPTLVNFFSISCLPVKSRGASPVSLNI